MGFGVQSSWFMIEGFRSRVHDLGIRVWGVGLRVQCLGFGV